MKIRKTGDLQTWQSRLDSNMTAYQGELDKMQIREAQYAGDRALRPTTEPEKDKSKRTKETKHVWNITAENIESEIDSSIPMPKVTPRRKEDEALARMIENMIRNELDRLPTEEINDAAERIVKKQGGVLYLPEWDASQRTHNTVGENVLQAVHPQRFIPQHGVQEVDDMDYYFLLIPTTKQSVLRRYGIDVKEQTEEMPELRGENDGAADDMVTLKMAVYKNEDGGIGRYAWVGETEVENLKDCQARRLRRCKKCGATEIDSAFALDEPTTDGTYPQEATAKKVRKGTCAYCGSVSWEDSIEQSRSMTVEELISLGVPESVVERLQAKMGYGAVQYPEDPSYAMEFEGQTIEGSGMVPGAEAIPTETNTGDIAVEVPYYSPNVYPVVLQRNVSAYGTFLGESDCDKIADQQNTINRMEQKILDRLVKAGSKIVLPDNTHLRVDPHDQDVWYAGDIATASSVGIKDFTGDISPALAYMSQVYEESRRLLGITDSFQGRSDATATSGKAKEFAAAQSAGRLESKRVLKKAAFAKIFERMFKNRLAYCDERRPMTYRDDRGNQEFDEWNSYKFLEMDEADELYWNDQFIFSCDNASGLAANREAMWQETTGHLQSGAFGDPTQLDTLVSYWALMEVLHYPGAGEIKKMLETRKQEQQQLAMMQMAAQQKTAMGNAATPPVGMAP